MDTAWIALVGTLMGGAGFKIIEHFLNKNQVKVDVATTIREELRGEVGRLRDDLRLEEQEADSWRTKYYETLEKHLNDAVKIDQLKARLEALDNKINKL